MTLPAPVAGTIAFARHPAPEVSVIVLAYRRHDLLEHSLRALASHATRHRFEVVVVLNGATPAVRSLVGDRVTGATVILSQANLGFAGGCNRARTAARAPLLVLLNDDAEVQPGWLDALVGTAGRRPGLGAVGSAVVAPDGSAFEVGSLLWRDGSTLGVGRGRSPDDPDLGHLRQVDYASACSLLVPAPAWDLVGGMDERYYPAYYDDVDLCLRLRAAGLPVYVQPTSRVLHHESSSLASRYLGLVCRRTRAVFHERWSEQLALQPEARPTDERAVLRAVRAAERVGRRVLVVDDDVPRPASGSGHGRMHDLLVELADAGVGVALHPTAPRRPGCGPLGAVGVRLVPDLARELASQRHPFDVVLISRPHNHELVAATLRAALPDVPIVYDAEALFHRRLRLEAALEPSPERTAAAARAEVVERDIAADADHVLAISDEEAEVLAAFAGDRRRVTVRAPFTWSVRSSGPPFAARRGAAFVSGWLAGATGPNADGLRWFARSVLPHALAALPWLEVRVTGADPPPSLLCLASPALRFVGDVDLDQLHDEARVTIVPLRVGAGVKLKVVDALEAGVPVVATSIGAEGLPAPVRAAIDVADEPAAFAAALVRLLTDPGWWEERRAAVLALDGAGPPPPPLAELLRDVRRRPVGAGAARR